jgi:hypothetical protein
MPSVANLVRVTTATTGTGTVTLGSAVSGFISPSSAGMVDGQVYAYTIEADYVTVGDDSVPTSREVGHGTYASGAGTLTRTVVNSTNANALLNLAGDAQVIIAFTTETYSISKIAPSDNIIINAALEVDQERVGASLATAPSGSSIGDMFRLQFVGAAAFTVQRVADAPIGFENSAKISVTTADASLAATDQYIIYHGVEGYRIASLGWGAAGASSVALGFWVKMHRTGTYSGSFGNSGAARGYTFEYTVNAADTWEYKTVVIPGDTSGTWNITNGAGIYMEWALAIGSNFQQAAGSWQTLGAGEVSGTSNQVNAVAATTDTFQITGVTLVRGSVPVPQDTSTLMMRPFDEELTLCQRYYEKTFNYSVAPATATATYLGSFQSLVSKAGATANFVPSYHYKVKKRAAPTVTIYSPDFASNQFENSNGLQCTASAVADVGENGHRAITTPDSTSAVGNLVFCHYVMDSRL